MLNTRVVYHYDLYRLKVDEDSFIGRKLQNGFFDKRFDKTYQCILRQLDFDIENINDYEVLRYQKAKTEEISRVICKMERDQRDIRQEKIRSRTRKSARRLRMGRHSRSRSKIGGQGEIEYLSVLHQLANRKRHKVFELYDEVFDVEYDVIEDRLENLNEDIGELNEERVQDEVEKSGSLISSLMDFF